jgi:hypothetical protein
MNTNETYIAVTCANLETALEALIDRHGLTHVVNTLAVLCTEKAEHIRANWQDRITAKAWETDGRTLDKAARSICSDGGA